MKPSEEYEANQAREDAEVDRLAAAVNWFKTGQDSTTRRVRPRDRKPSAPSEE